MKIYSIYLFTTWYLTSYQSFLATQYYIFPLLCRPLILYDLFNISILVSIFAGNAMRRKHTSNHATPLSTIPLSSSTFSLTTKQRKEKESKADSKFLSSVQTQPELYNLDKSKVATEFNLEKAPQADLGKPDVFKTGAELINPEPRKTTPEPDTNLDKNSIDSSKRVDPFRVSQESFKIGDIIPDDFKPENDIFKDGLDVFKIGQTMLRRSKDGPVMDRDHGDVTFGSHPEGRPRFDIGDLW